MFEKLGKKQLLDSVREIFDEAVSADRTWQTDAQESFEFRDNNQWSKEEEEQLNEERRPHLTFNITKAHIDLIMGINEDLRKRYVCTPVSQDDAFKCEILNNIIFWLYEKNSWHDEEDIAFESAVICGRGWTAIDFDLHPNRYDQIKVSETNIPIHEVRRDPASRKTDLSDASYVIWDKWLSIEDFIVKYPEMESKVLEAFDTGTWPLFDTLQNLSPENKDWPGDINDISDYEDQLDVDFYDSKKRQVRVAHMEYWKNVKKYWVKDIETQQWNVIDKKWSVYKKEFAAAFPGVELVFETRTSKEVWWIQFSGDEVLFHGRSPIDFPGFNIIPCFLYNDVSQRRASHFGVVELIKDAQREMNKRISQVLNMINQQVQPGLYAEMGAFINKEQAEQSVKETGSITWMQNGSINQKRFQERSVPTFPSAVMTMAQWDADIMRRITGINPDLMGQNDKRQEAGIVVQLRQQQGMTILKPVFKAYDRMKRELFKRQIRIITQHMPLSQIKLILGEGDRYKIDRQGTIQDSVTEQVCNVRDFRNLDYDIDGEPEQASMTQSMMELATYTEMQQNGFPVDPTVIVSKTNLPSTEKIGWIEYINNQQESQSQQAEQQFALEKQKLDQLHEREMGKIKLEAMIAGQKIENQREKDHLKSAGDQANLNDTKERDMLNLSLKTMEFIQKVKEGNKESAQKLLEMMTDTQLERQKMVVQLVETFIKSGKDIKVAKIAAEAARINGEKKKNESTSNKAK